MRPSSEQLGYQLAIKLALAFLVVLFSVYQSMGIAQVRQTA